MIFKVGPWTYRVKLTERLNGGKDAGQFDWKAQTLWIAANMPPHRRLATLLHELRHAWQTDMGRTASDEDDANQVASFTADVMAQLMRQGGEPALRRMTLEGIVDLGADVGMAAEPRHPGCPVCGGYLEAPIRTDPAKFSAAYNRLLASKSAVCAFCDHTVSWQETVTSAGLPTGSVIGKPVTSRAATCP